MIAGVLTSTAHKTISRKPLKMRPTLVFLSNTSTPFASPHSTLVKCEAIQFAFASNTFQSIACFTRHTMFN